MVQGEIQEFNITPEKSEIQFTPAEQQPILAQNRQMTERHVWRVAAQFKIYGRAEDSDFPRPMLEAVSASPLSG
jgi:hypothetical protein